MNPKQVLANEQAGDLGQKWLTDERGGQRARSRSSAGSRASSTRSRRWPTTGRAGRRKDHVGGVILKLVRESAAQRAALLRGEADIVEGLSADDYDQVAKTPGIVVPNLPGMTTFGLKMNTQKAPTQRRQSPQGDRVCLRLRRRCSRSTTATRRCRRARSRTRREATSAVPGIPRQDLAKAKEFLAKSAYPNGGIELEYVYVQGLEEERKMGLVLIDNLRQAEHQGEDGAADVAEHGRDAAPRSRRRPT